MGPRSGASPTDGSGRPPRERVGLRIFWQIASHRRCTRQILRPSGREACLSTCRLPRALARAAGDRTHTRHLSPHTRERETHTQHTRLAPAGKHKSESRASRRVLRVAANPRP